MTNTNLTKAKSAKNDEFYTLMVDIAAELAHYKGQFNGKVIFCGCDYYKKSNFYKFCTQNFIALGIKRVVCSGVENAETMKGSYVEFDGTTETIIENCDGTFQTNIPKVVEKYGAENVVFITNPPFSLFRELIAILEEHKLKYLLIGNGNAITYKDVFLLIKDDKIRLGYKSMSSYEWFVVPDGNKFEKMIDGEPCVYLRNRCWFTNLKVDVTAKCAMAKLMYDFSKPDTLESYYELSEAERNEKYPKYDNYDAINIDKCKDIPGDYFGVIGVPISFLYYLDPSVWDIVAFRKGNDGTDLVFTREREFNRTFVSLFNEHSRDDKERRRKNQWENYLRSHNNSSEATPIDCFHPLLIDGVMNNPKDTMVDGKSKYARVIIQRR